MIEINRTRVKESSSIFGNDTYYNPGVPATCKEPILTKSRSTTLKNFNSIDDFVPVGKFHPGKYKATDVVLKDVKYSCSQLHARYFYATQPECPQYIIDGHFIKSVHATSSSFLISTELVMLPPDIRTRLLAKALAKAKSDNVGLGESLAEARQTVGMMKSPLSSMASLLRNVLFKRSNRRFRRSAEDASAAWLEYRYGWTPLLMTLSEVVKDLPNFVEGRLYSQGATETVTSPISVDPRVYQKDTVSPYLYWWIHGEKSEEVVRRVRVHYSVTDAIMKNAASLGGSIFNALPLAWELVPLSFVVDWWLNVGDMIKCLIPAPYLHFKGYTYSSQWTIKWSTILEGITGSSNRAVNYHQLEGSRDMKKSIYMRDADLLYDDTPFLPSFDVEYRNWKHVVDALGLIIQRAV